MNNKKTIYESILIILICLFVGLFIGRAVPQNLSVSIQSFAQELYLKFHPDSQKDTQTLIRERVMKDTVYTPTENIFEEQKRIGFVQKIKLFFNKKDKSQEQNTINNITFD